MPGSTSPLGFPYPAAGDALSSWRATAQEFAEAVDDYLAALAAVAAVDWTDATLGSGWAHLSSSEHTAYARRAGTVTLALAASKATYTAGETICTLPSGFRPARAIRFVGEFNGAGKFLVVNTDGTVTPNASGTDGTVGVVSFPV